jgi:SAM-dependent methyltransferase
MTSQAIPDRQWRHAQEAQASNWKDKGAREGLLLHELIEHTEVAIHLHSFLDGVSGLTGLEVGIGPLGIGLLAVYVSNHFSRITGIEPLPVLAIHVPDKALQTYATDLQSRVETVMGKGEELPFDDGAFDVVCCINVVDHAQSPRAILAEIARVTKPGGLFIFGVNTLSFLGRQKWRMLRSIRPGKPLFVAHPHIFSWRQARDAVRADWAMLWENEPSAGQKLAGHGRMSFWIIRRGTDAKQTGYS